MHKTSDTKIDFLGWVPKFEEEFIDSQSIIAFSALLSFKGRKSVKSLFKEIVETSRHSGPFVCHSERSEESQGKLREGSQPRSFGLPPQDDIIRKKVQAILRHSSLRGHASLSTTPALCITFQGSKFLDSLLTGIQFSSSLMASGRRVQTSEKDIVYPDAIYKRKGIRNLYKKQIKKNIDFLNFMLKKGVPKDAASKIVPYGLVGTGTLVLTLESLIGLEREIETEAEWMPEDAKLFINNIKKNLKKFGLDDLYYTRKVAPRNTYPYPNIFKNPKFSNLARDFSEKLRPGCLSAIVDFKNLANKSLAKRLEALNKEIQEMATSKRKIKNHWYKILLKRKQICRDYNLAVSLSVISSVSWRVWGEKKRHRTVPQVVDSIYASVERALGVFEKAYKTIKSSKIEDKLLKEIDFVFAVPPVIAKDKKICRKYLRTAADSLLTYQKLVEKGIPPREAIYVVPRGIRIFVLQQFDLYNLITGYYPLRLCPTAEEQMQRRTEVEFMMIKKLLSTRHAEFISASKSKGILKQVQDDKASEVFTELLSLIVPKCHLTGFCPEQKFCGKIKSLVPDYDQDFHQEMKEQLEKKFSASKLPFRQ